MSDARLQIERNADRIRDELFRTVKELDRRRLRMMDVRGRLLEHEDVLVGLGLAVGVTASGLVGYGLYRSRTRRRRLWSARRALLLRAWRKPGRLNQRKGELTSLKALEKIALAFAIALGSQLAKRSAAHMLPRGELMS